MTPTITEADVREAIRAHFFAPEGLMLEVLRTARRAALKREWDAAEEAMRRYGDLHRKRLRAEARARKIYEALEAAWKETP